FFIYSFYYLSMYLFSFLFPASTPSDIYTLSLHDALPIFYQHQSFRCLPYYFLSCLFSLDCLKKYFSVAILSVRWQVVITKDGSFMWHLHLFSVSYMVQIRMLHYSV